MTITKYIPWYHSCENRNQKKKSNNISTFQSTLKVTLQNNVLKNIFPNKYSAFAKRNTVALFETHSITRTITHEKWFDNRKKIGLTSSRIASKGRQIAINQKKCNQAINQLINQSLNRTIIRMISQFPKQSIVPWSIQKWTIKNQSIRNQ